MINIRKLALILGVSYVALCAALADGRVVLPPAPLVQQYLNGNPAVTSDHIMQSMILPGLGAFAGFMAGGGAGGVSPASVFASTLYTAAPVTVTTGIDLATKGGLVWVKDRVNAYELLLYDTVRGDTKYLRSNGTYAQVASTSIAISTTGFTDFGLTSGNSVAWSFAKAAKFFDIVTYTGNGTNSRSISHSLGTTPGLIIYKRFDSVGSWIVWHTLGNNGTDGNAYYLLNSTAGATVDNGTAFGNGSTVYAAPTSTNFTVSSNSAVNLSGGSYIAYLFAHDPTGIIQCGSYVGDGSTSNSINLGWQPQYVLIKKTNASGTNWVLLDAARTSANYLFANSSAAEGAFTYLNFTSNGFQLVANNTTTNNNGDTYIYMAIKA
jgi:hypothetical protein